MRWTEGIAVAMMNLGSCGDPNGFPRIEMGYPSVFTRGEKRKGSCRVSKVRQRLATSPAVVGFRRSSNLTIADHRCSVSPRRSRKVVSKDWQPATGDQTRSPSRHPVNFRQSLLDRSIYSAPSRDRGAPPSHPSISIRSYHHHRH